MPFFMDAQATFAATNSWDWSEVAKVAVKDGGLQFTFGPAPICLAILVFGIWLLWRLKFSKKAFHHYEVVEAELNIANIGNPEALSRLQGVG